jgi:hypothetical protein
MSLKDWLEKASLAKVQGSLDTEQAGVVNVKIEHNTYNYYGLDQ